ncbi:MAG: aldehyde dehydrogenase (NADP(+)) [Ferruginibacter sp.]
MNKQKEINADQVNEIMEDAWKAFHIYRKMSIHQRAFFMKQIANRLEGDTENLIETAIHETNLQEARLRGELTRTMFQLNSYAEACEKGQWLEARIDTADNNKIPAKPDIRKMLVPLGPVVVFGASNFPFAYSTAGGDTASAFAAGCPVIVKGHPAHPQTSALTAALILKAATDCNMPRGIFAHVPGHTNAEGEALVKHFYTRAVGFTGSFAGGKQLFDWGNQRKYPIPVFAEMGSVNPIFLLPEKIKSDHLEMARQCAASIILGCGQFCTNPGIIVGLDNTDLEVFITILKQEIRKAPPAPMLNEGIFKNYEEKKGLALSQPGVDAIAVSDSEANVNQGTPTVAATTAKKFIQNQQLHQEVFGPYSIIIKCADMEEMKEVAIHLEGQLTTSLMATENDLIQNDELVEMLKDICGRVIINGVPTGVEVCLSMHHGGPFPATTDSRFTSVGADAIKRFARPISFQNWPQNLLPEELQNHNPLNIWRTVNNQPGNIKI